MEKCRSIQKLCSYKNRYHFCNCILTFYIFLKKLKEREKNGLISRISAILSCHFAILEVIVLKIDGYLLLGLHASVTVTDAVT